MAKKSSQKLLQFPEFEQKKIRKMNVNLKAIEDLQKGKDCFVPIENYTHKKDCKESSKK